MSKSTAAMKFPDIRKRIKRIAELILVMLLTVLGNHAVAQVDRDKNGLAQGLGAERIAGLKEASKTVFAIKARAASQSPLAPFQETVTQLRQMIDAELKAPLIVAAEPVISGQKEANRPRGRSPEKSVEREQAFRAKQQAFDEKRTRLNDIKAQHTGRRESNAHGLVESAATHLEALSLEFKAAIDDTSQRKIERLAALKERLKAKSDVSIEDEVTSPRLLPSISTRLEHRPFGNVAK
jgi:hypothetical protein